MPRSKPKALAEEAPHLDRALRKLDRLLSMLEANPEQLDDLTERESIGVAGGLARMKMRLNALLVAVEAEAARRGIRLPASATGRRRNGGLPAATLRRLVALAARRRSAARGGTRRGLRVLFLGPSRTARRRAAEDLAAALSLDLHRVDLGSVVSKYIGETEKNLARVFDAAERGDALLFFDEADALFGKRSEVRDSHDRYANVDVGFLLARIERYAGVVVLASNRRENFDPAFLRRLDVVVRVPAPKPSRRRRLTPPPASPRPPRP